MGQTMPPLMTWRGTAVQGLLCGAPPSVGGAFPYTALPSGSSQHALTPSRLCEQDQKADMK